MRIQIFCFLTVLCLQLPFSLAQGVAPEKAADLYPMITGESDYILKDFHFVNGESLPELKLHYRTIGQPTSNPSSGEVKNAVLLIHGTTGTGKEFLAEGFRDVMFEAGQTQGHMTLGKSSIYAPIVADFLAKLPVTR